MSEPCLNPGLGRPSKVQKFPSPTTTFSDKIELPKGVELQSAAEIAWRSLSYHQGLCPKKLSFYFFKSTFPETSLSLLPLVIDPPQPTAVPWTTYVNWFPPSIFRVRTVRWPKQSKIDVLNLTQIIKEPTRYNPKSVPWAPSLISSWSTCPLNTPLLS
jgi:hypothetical protein